MGFSPARDCAPIALLLASFVASGGTVSDRANRTDVSVVGSRDTLAFGYCAVALPDATAIRGTPTVPVDHSELKSDRIGLSFAFFPLTRPNKQTDPVVIYTGGSGWCPARAFLSIPARISIGEHPSQYTPVTL